MKVYINENNTAASKAVVLDDMILTVDLPTTGGSKMLEGYQSLFGATVVDRLTAADYGISGKANVGEFAIDLLGETSYFGACEDEQGNLTDACAQILQNQAVKAAITLDVNGAPRRGAALGGKVLLKPTYGTVSRFGTIPAACSGETVSVMARNADDCKEVLGVIVGHDDKDGTSLSEEQCATALQSGDGIHKVAVIKALCDGVDQATADRIQAMKDTLQSKGITVEEIDGEILTAAKGAWNILMSAELCNNVSRYDGVKYGYRSPNYKNIDELYTNSRTEAFGELLKMAILFGSDTLSTENYQKVYDKALRIRRVVVEACQEFLNQYDALLLPACGKAAYTKAEATPDNALSYEESLYTAPASITGLPALITGGVQLIGKAFSDGDLLDLAKLCE